MGLSEYPQPQDIPRRAPVLDADSIRRFSINDLDIQWGYVTETLRRNLLVVPETRRALIGYCTTPLSETLPSEMITRIESGDHRVARLAERYKDNLGGYLCLPAVPEESIGPDIKKADYPLDPTEELAFIKGLYEKKSFRLKHLQELIDTRRFFKGITTQERELIARRYKYARDVKLLALGAELQEEGIPAIANQSEVTLKSGITIGFNTSRKEEIEDMLHPELWEKRTQIQDRVNEIYVNGRKYILKEKKTSRHTDTKKHGHKPGYSSSGEFATAKEFYENESADLGDIRISWEMPIGHVTFPDGYQFAVFEHIDNLVSTKRIIPELQSRIVAHSDQFETEYQKVSAEAEKFKSHEIVRALNHFLPQAEIAKPFHLSFEEFAQVKALYWRRQAQEAVKSAIVRRGYSNADFDGYGFVIHDDHKLQLEIVGLDFEYYQKLPADKISEIQARIREFDSEIGSKTGINFLHWDDGQLVSSAQEAAYLAMRELEGIYDKAASQRDIINGEHADQRSADQTILAIQDAANTYDQVPDLSHLTDHPLFQKAPTIFTSAVNPWGYHRGTDFLDQLDRGNLEFSVSRISDLEHRNELGQPSIIGCQRYTVDIPTNTLKLELDDGTQMNLILQRYRFDNDMAAIDKEAIHVDFSTDNNDIQVFGLIRIKPSSESK